LEVIFSFQWSEIAAEIPLKTPWITKPAPKLNAPPNMLASPTVSAVSKVTLLTAYFVTSLTAY
jgi:hypothetical protein